MRIAPTVAQLVQFLQVNVPKTAIFDLKKEKRKKKKEKKVKHLMRVPEFYWYLIHLTLILVRELSFRRKNMTYKMVQNLA